MRLLAVICIHVMVLPLVCIAAFNMAGLRWCNVQLSDDSNSMRVWAMLPLPRWFSRFINVPSQQLNVLMRTSGDRKREAAISKAAMDHRIETSQSFHDV
jgi:hypothetical protein